MVIDGKVHLEGIATYLPRGCFINMREEVASIDGDSFYQFAQALAVHVKYLTIDGRKVLLTFDACRIHDPAHIRASTGSQYCGLRYALQPLDTVLFGCFKQKVNANITAIAKARADAVIDLSQLCAIRRDAFCHAFTRPNVVTSFARAGVWPVDHTCLLSVPRPRSKHDQRTARMAEIEQMLINKQDDAARAIVSKIPWLCDEGTPTRRRVWS